MKRMFGLLTLLVCLIPTTTIGESKGLQKTFEEKRASFSILYDSFGNQIKKSGVYTETGQWARQFITEHPVFENFVGEITQIETNKGGSTVSVRIISQHSKKIKVEYHSTVSKSETKVYNQLADLSLGTKVSFTWTPYPDEETGITERSIRERGMVANPWFVGKLSDVRVKVKGEGNYVDGKQEGKWVGYYDSGKVEWEGNFVDGIKEGKTVWYYESGKVELEANYVDGELDGKYVGYYSDEQIEWEENFKDGKRDGKRVMFYDSGKVKGEGNYVDGKQEGKWVGYYDSGKVRWEGNYKDGKKEGKKVWYAKEGNITDEDIYKDGECVEWCEEDE